MTITIGGDFSANIKAVEQGQADLEGAAIPFELQVDLVQRAST